MKDTIHRPAAVRVLASVPAWEVPVVAMATRVDPILTLDRIACFIAFADLAQQDGRREAAQEKGREVTHTDEDAHEAAAAARNAVSEPRDAGVWRQS